MAFYRRLLRAVGRSCRSAPDTRRYGSAPCGRSGAGAGSFQRLHRAFCWDGYGGSTSGSLALHHRARDIGPSIDGRLISRPQVSIGRSCRWARSVLRTRGDEVHRGRAEGFKVGGQKACRNETGRDGSSSNEASNERKRRAVCSSWIVRRRVDTNPRVDSVGVVFE
jgi:hypothetical protein